MNVYQRADEAIKAMNRKNLAEFDQLKVIREVQPLIKKIGEVYQKSEKRAREYYYEIAFEAYAIALHWCGKSPKEASRMAEKAIDSEWVDLMLTETNLQTLYRFTSEAERKKARLIEAVAVAENRDAEIEKALRLWTGQVGQYALCAVDLAMRDAYEDAGVEEVMWNSEQDDRVCSECNQLDGQIFPLDEVPPKPHLNCRCWLTPVIS